MRGGEGCPVPRGERYGRTLIISPLTPRRRSLPPTTRVSHSPTRASATAGERGARNQSLFLLSSRVPFSHDLSSPSLSPSVCLSVCRSVCCMSVRPSVPLSIFLYFSLSLSLSPIRSLALRIFPNFVSVLLSLYPAAPLHPYALREIDFSTESPLPAFPKRGNGGRGREGEGVCNVFATYFISSTHLCNYYCIKKPSATSRQRQLHYLHTRYLHCIISVDDVPNSSGA